MKLIYRMGTALAAGSLIASSLATGVLADTATISTNGVGSNNTIVITNTCSVTVEQRNRTRVSVDIDLSASTGGNTANNNTGGDVSITTGNATNTADVTIGGSENTATVPDCCECQTPVDATISGNGVNSTNHVTDGNSNTTNVKQKNKTKVKKLKVKAKAKTGKNTSSGNTNGTTTVQTGEATNSATVTVDPPSNNL